MVKQNKYFSEKVASDQAKTLMTTLRFDKITKDNLDELQSQSGLSQSQVVRKLINGEHILQKDLRVEIISFRDKLNHLAMIAVSPEQEQAIANLEQEYLDLKEKFIGGN